MSLPPVMLASIAFFAALGIFVSFVMALGELAKNRK